MFVVTVEFKIKPECWSDFIPLMKLQADNSVKLEEGCSRFDVCLDENGWSVFLYEVYRHEAAFQEHLKAEHFLQFDRAVATMVVSKAVTTFASAHVGG